jgi:hypothetical protein
MDAKATLTGLARALSFFLLFHVWKEVCICLQQLNSQHVHIKDGRKTNYESFI